MQPFGFRERGLFRRTVSGIVLALLLTSILTLAFNIQPAKAEGTIYVRADGSIDPPTAPISTLDYVTYTLTGDIMSSFDGLVIQRNGIVVDGAGHTLQGSGNGTGIYWSGCGNVTVKNTQINAYAFGIYFFSSSSNSIIGNVVAASVYEGIYIEDSSNNSINGNKLNSNYGIVLSSSSASNSISGNNIANGNWGIYLYSASSNSIIGNVITADGYDAILLGSSSTNSIIGNNITASNVGIYLDSSSNGNSLSGNNVANDNWGIYLNSVSGNGISGNIISANNYYAIFLNDSFNNRFWHNNFIDNAHQVYIEGSTIWDVWDDGYPSGGNYWSNYIGVDLKSGPNQDHPGSDGIGDTSYVIDDNNTDHYPLMGAWGSTPAFNVTVVAHCNIEGVDVGVAIAEDGASTGFSTPFTFTNLMGTHTFTVPNIDANGHPFKKWSSGQTSPIITVYFGGTYTAIYDAAGPPIQVPEDYTSIQAAIDAATPWATILIGSGTYNESIVVNKPLIIIGTLGSEPVFRGGGSGIAITLLSGASGSTVAGIVITNWDQGILINEASDCKIYNNIMSLMSTKGILLQGATAVNNRVYNNIFQQDPIAVDLASSSQNNNVSRNIISLSTTAIKIETSGNIICANILSQNQVGINITNSNDNVIYHNNFVNNTVQVSVSESTGNMWDDGYPSGGNYWSDYTGVDLKSGPNQDQSGTDGIVDTPYTVSIGSVDRYPLVSPFNAHDVGVMDYAVSKTVVGKGYTLSLEVKVLNYGAYDENFLVTAYANTSTVAAQAVTLVKSNSIILILTWNTSSFAYGNYTVNAHAEPVLNETNTADNDLCCGTVYVGIPGDVNGNGGVDIYDAIILGNSFMSTPGSRKWNANANINNDNMVDIYDAIILAGNYGKTA
jgi:parallel beta-helix repeat protein